MHVIMKRTRKNHAPRTKYVSPSQMTLEGFESPFESGLDPKNRWVTLARSIPWDDICGIYLRCMGIASTGRPGLNPRIVIGALIIKHICNLDDRETVAQISENMYMQYFLGYNSFSAEAPFDASLFVEIRKRLGLDTINSINEKILSLLTKTEDTPEKQEGQKQDKDKEPTDEGMDGNSEKNNSITHKGRVLFDATACPQDIAYPTDLDLLSKAREKSEKLIDLLYQKGLHGKKPRNYRKVARKLYLNTAQKRNKTKKELKKAVGRQLRFLKRNLKSISKLLDGYDTIPLKTRDKKTYLVIQEVFQQQKEMFDNRTHSIADRIVSIHQPHVRPIVRGKSKAKTEFGAKVHISYIDGMVFLDKLSWDAFNEGSHLKEYISLYKNRFGFYPKEVLADKIYCTRENRKYLKSLGIKLLGKSLGRPSAVKEHVRPGERNPIEGKFGQAKTAYGLNRIRARLKETSETWIASIFLVLNLVKLTGAVTFCPKFKLNLKVFKHVLSAFGFNPQIKYFRSSYSLAGNI